MTHSHSRLRSHVVVIASLAIAATNHWGHAATTLALVGDIGGNMVNGTDGVAGLVASSLWQTDYVFTLGDNGGNWGVGAPEWEQVVGARYGQYIKKRSGQGPNPYPFQTSPVQRFFPVVGDHDREYFLPGTQEAAYFDYFNADPGQAAGRLPPGVHDSTQSYYDVELPITGGSGTIRVFALDSEAFEYTPGSKESQIAWLRNGLTRSTATWNFVTMHSPPYSTGPHSSNALFQLPFQQWGADAVLAGHDHIYERLRVTDAGQSQMLYFVNGLGGSNIYPFIRRAQGSEFRYHDIYGAMRLVVTDQAATFEFRALTHPEDDGSAGGILIDSFTLLHDQRPTPPLLTADFNDDGFVDSIDLSLLNASYGVNALADADGDGDSEGDDFLVWQRQKSNYDPTSPISITPVPEPSTLCGFIAALGATSLARRRRALANERRAALA